MEGECSEMSLHIYQTTRRHIQQENDPHYPTLGFKGHDNLWDGHVSF